MSSATARARNLPRPYRRTLLSLHVITSVGWLGISLANLALAIAVITTVKPQIQHSVYRVLEIVGNTVLLPISVSAFITGTALAIGTQWGLLRHRWVLTKLVLTLTTVLLTYLSLIPGLREASAIVDNTAADQLAAIDETNLLSAACVSTAVYTFNVVLSIFKPWGRTRWGRKAIARSATTAAA